MSNFKFSKQNLPSINDNKTSSGSSEVLYTTICDKILGFTITAPTLEKIYKEIPKIKELSNQNDYILYSAISIYIFRLDDKNFGVYFTNLEKIYNLILTEEKDCEIKKKIHKIYDHSKLASIQRKFTSDKINDYNKELDELKNRINEVNADIKKINFNINGITKSYITVLGIFTSIIFTFLGGFNFVTSILQNISNSSFYKLIVLAIVIGIILYLILDLLYKFIFKILEKEGSSAEKIHRNYIIGATIFALLALGIAFYFDYESSAKLYELLITNGEFKL